MCLSSVSSFVWFLSIFIPEKSSSHTLFPSSLFTFHHHHLLSLLPHPPPPLLISLYHSLHSALLVLPPTSWALTRGGVCARFGVHADVLVCLCVCGCGCKCVRVSESHRCCIAGLSPQGRLSHREEKEQSFPKLMTVCVCVTYMDVLWTWIWSEMPQPQQFSGARSWNGPRVPADIDPHQWHNPKPPQTLQQHADKLPNGPRQAGFLQYLAIGSKYEAKISLKAGKENKRWRKKKHASDVSALINVD